MITTGQRRGRNVKKEKKPNKTLARSSSSCIGRDSLAIHVNDHHPPSCVYFRSREVATPAHSGPRDHYRIRFAFSRCLDVDVDVDVDVESYPQVPCLCHRPPAYRAIVRIVIARRNYITESRDITGAAMIEASDE